MTFGTFRICFPGDRLLAGGLGAGVTEGVCLGCNDSVSFVSPEPWRAGWPLLLLGTFHFPPVPGASSHSCGREMQTPLFLGSFLKRRLPDPVLTMYLLSHLISLIRLLFTSEDIYLKIAVEMLHQLKIYLKFLHKAGFCIY